MRVSYIATTGVISTHTKGNNYSIDIPIKKYTPNDNTIGNQQTTLSKAETILEGTIYSHKFSTTALETEYFNVREFILSANDGQLITFDVFGSIATPNNPITGKLKLIKNLKPGQPAHKTFTYDFEILELS